jgi:hypothetical protein
MKPSKAIFRTIAKKNNHMADFKKIEQRYYTFNRILGVIQKKEAQDKYPSLIPVAASLKKKLKKIDALDWRWKPGKGSATKKKLRQSLSEAAHNVSCGVYAFGQITGNVALRNAVWYSYSDFYRSVESTMIGRCRQVLNAVKKVKNPEHYALTPLVIQKLQEELKKYIEFMHQPVNNIKRHARMYKQVENLLDQCLFIIQNQLDPLMTVINCTDSMLYSSYSCDRHINKKAGRKRKYVKKKKTEQEDIIAKSNLAENKSLNSEIENIIRKEKALNFEL